LFFPAWRHGCRRPSAGKQYQKLHDERHDASISEMATGERIKRGYLGTLLRLMLLAPEMVEPILNGRQPELSSVIAYGAILAI